MVANDAYRLGMEVMGYDPYVSVDTAWSISRRVHRAKEISEIFTSCDFITVHVPLQEKTFHLIGQKEIAMMKNSAQLFNFARSEIVDNSAVIEAIEADELAGFTTDFADEKLLHHDHITVLPHLGASTAEAETNSAKIAVRTLKKFIETGVIKRSVNFPPVEMAFHSPYRITIINRNVPNMLGQISAVIADSEINIDNMINRGRDDYAYTLVDIDENDERKIADVVEKLRATDDIIRVRVIKRGGAILNMVVVRPFKAIRPEATLADKVAELPYDVVDSAEARALAQDNPYSYFHIDKAEIDLPQSISPYDEAVYQKGSG